MATENYTLGRGEIYFGKFKPGTTTPDGFRFLGNCPDFSVSEQSTKLDHYRSTRGIKQKDLTIVTEVNRTSKVSAEDVSPENLALFLLGSAAVTSQASATALSETISQARYGRLYQLGISATNPAGVHSVTTVLVKKGVTSLVLDTDYTLDAARGMITLADASTVFADGDDLVVTYDLQAKSRELIISGSAAAQGSIKFVAYPAQGDPIDFYMPFVEISPNGDLSLISDNLMSVPLEIDIQTLGNLEAIYANGAPYVPA